MKVLLVTTSYPLDEQSSSGIFVKRLKNALDKLCQVEVVCPDDDISRSDVTGVCRSRYTLKAWQTLAHRPGGIPAAIRRDFRYVLLVPFLLLSMQISILRRLSACDVIFANWAINAWIAWLPSFLLQKPLITTFRGEDVRNLDTGLSLLIVRVALRVSDVVVLVSADMQESLIRRFPQYKKKLRVIHNGVEGSLLSEEVAAKFTAQNDYFHILTVASLIPRKDIATLLKALAIIQRKPDIEANLHLNVVGGGELMSPLKLLCKELNIENSVTFEGLRTPEQVGKKYRYSQIFVLPSLFEGRPNVVVEAMAAGCCVLVSDIDGCRELVSDGKSGYLVTAGNEQELVEKLIKVILNDSLRIRLGVAARKFVVDNNLSWDGCAREYQSLFSGVIKAI